jgi:acyl-CoA synthetase (AMP-forming)/AMP-acid ligase II
MPVAPDDTALLQYTSGSTGAPKGVVLTHANLLANIRAMASATAASTDDVFVSWLPLYHDMGLIGAWLGSLCVGFPLLVMSPLSFLARPVRWLRAISDHAATLSAAPNFGFELCVRRIAAADLAGVDLSSWRIAFNGAEPVSPSTLERFVARFEPYGLRPGALAPVYGLAEAGVGLTFPPPGREPVVDRIDRRALTHAGAAVPASPDDATAQRVVACGRALPGYEVRIVDTLGHLVGDRHEGRVEFRGPSATAGYYRDPEATRRLFDGGWLDTGDLGYTAGGDVYVTGRVKDIIIRAGRNLHPDELEEVVGAVPGVRTGCVAAFASADPEAGTERLVVAAETHLTDASARDALHAAIVDAAVDVLGTPPDEVVLLAPRTLPKTSSGKIRRAASRDRYERGELAQPRSHRGTSAPRSHASRSWLASRHSAACNTGWAQSPTRRSLGARRSRSRSRSRWRFSLPPFAHGVLRSSGPACTCWRGEPASVCAPADVSTSRTGVR